MKKRSSLLSVIIVMALLAVGCANVVTPSIKVQPEAFGKKKTYALVTIMGSKEFFGEKSITQAFKDVDEIPGANSQPILDKMRSKIYAKLKKSKHFKLVPEKHVLNSKAYKKLEADPSEQKVAFFTVNFNSAKGYKLLTDPKKLGKLAKDLKVDGVITVNASFSTVTSGFNVGPLGKKSYHATVTISVAAYDREGNVIWQDTTMKAADKGDSKAIVLIDPSAISGTNFKKLHPSAVKIGEYAMGVLMQRLDDKLSGKEVSRFQKMKDKNSP